jgi:hypothetical protein
MGKIHRIKKKFNRIVSQDPVPLGTHWLGGTVAHFGRSYGDGSLFAVVYYGHSYEKLVEKLVREYNERAV